MEHPSPRTPLSRQPHRSKCAAGVSPAGRAVAAWRWRNGAVCDSFKFLQRLVGGGWSHANTQARRVPQICASDHSEHPEAHKTGSVNHHDECATKQQMHPQNTALLPGSCTCPCHGIAHLQHLRHPAKGHSIQQKVAAAVPLASTTQVVFRCQARSGTCRQEQASM